MNESAAAVWQRLLEGNARFREATNEQWTYGEETRRLMSTSQKPIAAVITCIDSRIAPEVIFDQPLGTLLVCRVPGNVPSESAKWTVELAAGEFKLPLILVIGHTDCVAVRSVVDGESTLSGGTIRLSILSGMYNARANNPEDLLMETIKENAKESVRKLQEESHTLRTAVRDGETEIIPALFDISSGEVSLI